MLDIYDSDQGSSGRSTFDADQAALPFALIRIANINNFPARERGKVRFAPSIFLVSAAAPPCTVHRMYMNIVFKNFLIRLGRMEVCDSIVNAS